MKSKKKAVPPQGYRVVGNPDTVTAEDLERYLTTKWMGHPFFYYKEVTSTNEVIKELAEQGAAEGTLAAAEAQKAGKGRLGRSWTMETGKNVAMSLLLRPALAPSRISMITLVMGLAAASVCRERYALPAQIKWPNDVVIHGKKLCGILTELKMEETRAAYVVVGTGINVNAAEFPEELQDKATSLFLELGQQQERAELMALCMNYFESFYEKFFQTGDLSLLTDTYNALLVNKNREVRVLEPGNEYSGRALGINANGELLVKRADGSVTAVYAGEVSVRGVYGYV